MTAFRSSPLFFRRLKSNRSTHDTMSNRESQMMKIDLLEHGSEPAPRSSLRPTTKDDSIGLRPATSGAEVLDSATPRLSDAVTELQKYMIRQPLWVRTLVRRLPGKHIKLDGEGYLTRWMLRGDGSGQRWEVYIHHLHSVDVSRHLHNHPWPWFLAFVLAGHYRQDVLVNEAGGIRRETIRWCNFFRGQNRYHSIREVPAGGVWTLAITPPKNGHKWGYWDSERELHVPDDADPDSDLRSETTYFRGL